MFSGLNYFESISVICCSFLTKPRCHYVAVQASPYKNITLISSLVQYNLRGDHLCDRTAGRGHRRRHHTPVSPEDRASRPTRVRRQHAGVGHLHLPHLCGGKEEHRRSLCKAHFPYGIVSAGGKLPPFPTIEGGVIIMSNFTVLPQRTNMPPLRNVSLTKSDISM